MAWQLYQAIYELHSPLHIGYHKIGNLQRTRYYIPARNLWGAVTEQLTRSGFGARVLQTRADDYAAVGEWVNQHCAFGYWFVYENDTPLKPMYKNDGLWYDKWHQREFERRYLASHVTTALDAATTSAASGSLHEVEFLAPHNREGVRTIIGGWVCLDEEGVSQLAEQWRAWLSDLRVGGERRYGFGHLRLHKFEPKNESRWQLAEVRPRVQIEKDQPLEAHALAHQVKARGQIEPLVGRETQSSATFGTKLTRVQICWTPGSLVAESNGLFEITTTGVWQKVEG